MKLPRKSVCQVEVSKDLTTNDSSLYFVNWGYADRVKTPNWFFVELEMKLQDQIKTIFS